MSTPYLKGADDYGNDNDDDYGLSTVEAEHRARKTGVLWNINTSPTARMNKIKGCRRQYGRTPGARHE